jgi:hypothetical protein
MRKTVTTITKALYLLLTELIAVYLIAFPVYAFQVSSSSTGYVRVATQSAQLAYVAANRAALISTVASAAVAVSPASVAVRLVTGPVGWAALGVSVALTLAQMYYSTADLQTIKTAASPVPSGAATTYTFNGTNYAMPTNQFVGSPVTNPPCTGSGGKMYGWPGGSAAYPGWTPSGVSDWYCGPTVPFTPIQAPTPQQVADYLTGLPANNPNAPESHVTPVGQGAPVTPADNVTTNPVTPSQIAPTVKPAAQVTPTDTVIDPNAPAPAGAQSPVPATQTTTTTTTTTTNPDGSTTRQDADTATVSCSAGNHDQRTFGSVLQEHLTRWQGTGLLSALNLLKTLTWPTAIPTYSLQSSLLGTFTLDFTAWSGLLTALRSLIIALAAFVAYRIIFVGNA